MRETQIGVVVREMHDVRTEMGLAKGMSGPLEGLRRQGYATLGG